MSYSGEDTIWKRLLQVSEELGVAKDTIKKLEKRNDELEARWMNLNEDVKKSAKVKAMREYDWPRMMEMVQVRMEYDPYMYNATSERDFVEHVLGELYQQIREEIQRRNRDREKKPTS